MHWYSASTETEHQGQRKEGKCAGGDIKVFTSNHPPSPKQHTNIQISKYLKHIRPMLAELIQLGTIGFCLFSLNFMFSLRARVIASALICTINLLLCQQKVMRLLQCKNFSTLIIINCMLCSLFWKCFLHLLPCKVMLGLRIVLLFLFEKTFSLKAYSYNYSSFILPKWQACELLYPETRQSTTQLQRFRQITSYRAVQI